MDELYLLIMQTSDGKVSFADLFPTPKDTIISLKHKLINGEDADEPAWVSSEISVYKTTKERFCENFNEVFGEPSFEGGYSSWFDIYVNIDQLDSMIVEQIDLARFILENVQVE